MPTYKLVHILEKIMYAIKASLKDFMTGNEKEDREQCLKFIDIMIDALKRHG